MMQPSPQERAQVAEESRRVWAAVARLDERQAAAVQLHYREGWPLEEIAEALDCPVGTVKTLLFRGRERLRQLLKEDEG